MLGASLGLAPSLKWLLLVLLAARSINVSCLGHKIIFPSVNCRCNLCAMRSSDPLGTIEAFLKVDSNRGDRKYDMISVMEAFKHSHGVQNLHYSDRRQPFLGISLPSRVENSMTDTSEWHGLREWVQYELDDGVLMDEKPDERKQTLEITRWGLFVDQRTGVSYTQSELCLERVSFRRWAPPVARCEAEGRILWFQRGASTQARSFP